MLIQIYGYSCIYWHWCILVAPHIQNDTFSTSSCKSWVFRAQSGNLYVPIITTNLISALSVVCNRASKNFKCVFKATPEWLFHLPGSGGNTGSSRDLHLFFSKVVWSNFQFKFWPTVLNFQDASKNDSYARFTCQTVGWMVWLVHKLTVFCPSFVSCSLRKVSRSKTALT